MKHRDKIIELFNQGKSRTEICEILNCGKSLVCYHLTDGQKSRNYEKVKQRRTNPLIVKMETFKNTKSSSPKIPNKNIKRAIYEKIYKFINVEHSMTTEVISFTYEELLNKIGPEPKCYLTGQSIDLNKPSTYSLDHKMPKSRGGANSLDNLGLCTKQANMAKCDLTVEEFKLLCQTVVNNLK